MEKDSGRYRYEPYPAITKQNNGTNSLKRPSVPSSSTSGTPRGSSKCCSCLGRAKNSAIWSGLLTNLGICVLLFSYTLLGSFIFLAIEGGASTMHQRTLAATNRQLKPALKHENMSAAMLQTNMEARAKTVENIWDITVSLNILYRENWTRLAALEIARFQEQLVKRLAEEMASQEPSGVVLPAAHAQEYDWNFARAFLYSLTVLTTIGYGSIAPRTSLGRMVTLAYAVLGIPLTLIYLSSAGGLLARVARGVFSRALCCCLCSNCGYCCYDEKRMADKERRMKKKRQQQELRAQQLALQEPFYVRSSSTGFPSSGTHNNLHSPSREEVKGGIRESDSLSCIDNESKTSMQGLSLLAPIFLCLCIMLGYICLGAVALHRLENWPFLDGVYFCFMSLSTIGFGDLVPGLSKESTATTWFCSIYIMSGMALTAMCFNVLHEEIVHRLKHTGRFKKSISTHIHDDIHSSDAYNLGS